MLKDERDTSMSVKRRTAEGMDDVALQVLCARRGWTIVKPEFPHDDAHIRHSMSEVATPEQPHPVDVRSHALSGEWQAMSLRGNKRAPKHT